MGTPERSYVGDRSPGGRRKTLGAMFFIVAGLCLVTSLAIIAIPDGAIHRGASSMAAASATLGSVSQLALSAGLVSMVTGALFYGSGMLADEGDGGPGPGRSGPST